MISIRAVGIQARQIRNQSKQKRWVVKEGVKSNLDTGLEAKRYKKKKRKKKKKRRRIVGLNPI